MSREKQIIEDMAKVIEITEQIARDAHCGLPSPTMYAKDLYWHGYRKQEWISVDERLPERQGYYLGYTYKGLMMIAPFFPAYADDKPEFKYDISYWMPLPEAPKMKGSAE